MDQELPSVEDGFFDLIFIIGTKAPGISDFKKRRLPL